MVRDKERLEKVAMAGAVYNITDIEKFRRGLELIKESLFDKGQSLFVMDNIITWNRNYSFARIPFFKNILDSDENSNAEKSIIWRTYVLTYFANFALSREGDFVELGCLTGYSALQIIKKTELHNQNKDFYLFDLFEWNEGDKHQKLTGHDDPDMYKKIKKRFEKYPFVKIVKGLVPDSFKGTLPDKICFCHIDMNNAEPEMASLSVVLPRLQSGGVVLLDDYGWWGYSAQKIGLDPIAESHGLEILELPTGQGLILKP